MNLASALIKQVLELSDFDTWAKVRKHYLPTEYHQLFDAVDKHTTKYHKLPKVEELKLAVRDSATLDKVYALDAIQTDAEPFLLLEYLKNEFAQKEALISLDRYIDNSIAFETAEEVVKSLQQISIDIESKVEIKPDQESMQKINLFESEDEMARRIRLGLNAEFDAQYDFYATDAIFIGGKRGSGKSITCNNIGRRIIDLGKPALYFSTEMETRQVLQRDAAIATKIPFGKIRNKNLSILEWETIAKWWSNRFINGEEHLHAYMKHHDFNRFHTAVSHEELVTAQLDIVYDPLLTIPKIRAEVDKRLALGAEPGVILVDYINKVRKNNFSDDNFDWKAQIEISTFLKQLAQDTGIPVVTPYQIDASGEARFAKGILDAADAAMILEAHDNAITFKITKMRNADDEFSFTSAMDWTTLTIGPESAEPPEPEVKTKDKIGTKKTRVPAGLYEDESPPFDPD